MSGEYKSDWKERYWSSELLANGWVVLSKSFMKNYHRITVKKGSKVLRVKSQHAMFILHLTALTYKDEGITASNCELARRMGVAESTTIRIRKDLQDMGLITECGPWHKRKTYFLDPLFARVRKLLEEDKRSKAVPNCPVTRIGYYNTEGAFPPHTPKVHLMKGSESKPICNMAKFSETTKKSAEVTCMRCIKNLKKRRRELRREKKLMKRLVGNQGSWSSAEPARDL